MLLEVHFLFIFSLYDTKQDGIDNQIYFSCLYVDTFISKHKNKFSYFPKYNNIVSNYFWNLNKIQR